MNRPHLGALAALAMLLVSAAASAQTAPAQRSAPPPASGAGPTGDDMLRYYPEAARAAGTEGAATIACTLTRRGTLEKCVVVSETPAGAGFGEATLRLADRFKMRPRTKDGRSVAGRQIRIPVIWRLGE